LVLRSKPKILPWQKTPFVFVLSYCIVDFFRRQIKRGNEKRGLKMHINFHFGKNDGQTNNLTKKIKHPLYSKV